MSDEINMLGFRQPLRYRGSEPKSPEVGDVYLDTSDGKVGNIMFYDGTSWLEFASSEMGKELATEYPFPMPEEDYDRAMEMIKEMGIEF